MAKRIKGKLYYLVDIWYDDDFIYEVYEDEQGNKKFITSGVIE